MKTISFIAVCQKGMLEVLSMMCFASLRKNIQCELIAALPEQFGSIHNVTLSVLKELNVKIVPIENTFNPEYKIGNKLFAANINCNTNKKIFIDSDVVCLKPVKNFNIFTNKCAATPISPFRKLHGHNREHWISLYKYFGMNIDEPFQYYIANFIVINQSFDFSKRWLENAKKVHEAIHSRKLPIVPESPKVREIDQLSLALTVSQKPEDFNSFPPFHWNQSKEAVSKSPNPDTSDYIGGQGWWMKDPSTPLENMNYNKIINYVEAVRFFKNNKLICRALPYFLVTQKGFFYRPHIQGTVVPELNDVNNLSYFPKIRSLIFQIVKEIPQIKNHPMWKEYKDNWIGKHVKM